MKLKVLEASSYSEITSWSTKTGKGGSGSLPLRRIGGAFFTSWLTPKCMR